MLYRDDEPFAYLYLPQVVQVQPLKQNPAPHIQEFRQYERDVLLGVFPGTRIDCVVLRESDGAGPGAVIGGIRVEIGQEIFTVFVAELEVFG